MENQVARVRQVVKLHGYEVSLVNYIGKNTGKKKIELVNIDCPCLEDF